MKKVNVILVAVALLFGTLTSYAAVDPVVTTSETTKEIGKLLKNPGFEVNSEINAMVTFIINKEGQIVVLSVDCETKTVCKYIKSRLNYNTLGSELEKGKEYKVPIRIKSEA
ncbi:MAG: hypothetical protein COB12_05695 [Flavobacterium sp.]|nr:MAG: hypothetical protein COB12_05695 [Flavobacterium sp.]